MKFKTTQKAIKEGYKNIICLGYCSIPYLLKGNDADAYTSGIYGWNADIYKINSNTVIVTGYRPFGNINPSYELVEEYENRARKIYKEHCGAWDDLKSILDELLEDFVKKIIDEEE